LDFLFAIFPPNYKEINKATAKALILSELNRKIAHYNFILTI